MRMNLMTKV